MTTGPFGPAARRLRGKGWSLSRSTWRRLILLIVMILVFVAGGLIHPPYVLLRSGPVYDTLGAIDGRPVIEVSDAPTYDSTGDLAFTTVAVYGGRDREITFWDYLIARFQPQTEIRPVDEVYPPDVTREQIREQTQAQMQDAQAEAKAVALRATGRAVPETVTVTGVVGGGPADGVLRKGDRVLSLAGKPVTGAMELRQAIGAGREGQKLTLVVRRGGADVPVQVGTTEQDGRRIIGVALGLSFDFPLKVTINAGDIGGPSAGLMFALGLYDRLTPDSLTGGAKIAGTGTIADDGAVGPIGGISHKMRGARDTDGAQWFLAPEANCADVRGQVPDGLRVVKVGTFDEAKRAVEEIGAGRGDVLAGCG